MIEERNHLGQLPQMFLTDLQMLDWIHSIGYLPSRMDGRDELRFLRFRALGWARGPRRNLTMSSDGLKDYQAMKKAAAILPPREPRVAPEPIRGVCRDPMCPGCHRREH